MERLRDLKGLGPASEAQLILAGINTPEDLRRLGAIPAFLKLKQEQGKVSLNFLYALVGAIEGESWLKIAREERSRLLTNLEGYRELEEALKRTDHT